MHMRQASPADKDKLVALIDEVCGEGMMATTSFVPTPAWQRMLDDGINSEHMLLVVEHAGDIIGWCRLFPTDRAGEAELGIGVHKRYRHQNIGATLLKQARQWAEAHYNSLVLQTHKDNLPAQKLFEKFGFILETPKAQIVTMRLNLLKELQ
jgi:RimJ/RimL family protein N-acetyltransferase